MQRSSLLEVLAVRIVSLNPPHPVRVAVDGADGVGKTTLAGELVNRIAEHRPVIRASVDGFHNPRSVRYRLGRSPPGGWSRGADSHGQPRLDALKS
jgi:uridine kinase